MEDFNVDEKAECGQLNLAYGTRKKNLYIKRKLKQTNASALHLVRYRDAKSAKAFQD